MIVHKLLYLLTRNRPTRLISLDSGPYLERYYLGRLLGVTFYLHRFVSSDSERYLHNHPWGWGRALVLAGRYLEEVVVDITTSDPRGVLTDTRMVRWWNRINGNHFHRITEARPNTWTLFFHGPRIKVYGDTIDAPVVQYKGWGFLEKGAGCVLYVPWRGGSNPDWWRTAPKGKDSEREPS